MPSGERHHEALPPVWFERAVVPEFLDQVCTEATLLGPASDSPDDPYRDLAEAQGIVASTHTYDAAVLDRAPKLRVIARTGIGYDRVDVAEATKRAIAVCNAPDGPTVSTAEHAVMLMMMVAKNAKRSEAELRGGGDDFYAGHVGVELQGKTLGLVGYGRIARHVARIVGGLGMIVRAYDPFVPERSFPEGVRAHTMEELLAEADVVSVHIPLTEDNAGLFSTDLFALVKPGAIFVNTARGGLVDLDALTAALDADRLFGAGLDVTLPEPLPPDHPLLGRLDVVVTPHVASGTPEAKQRIFATAFGEVIHVLRGERPEHLVNPDVWERVVNG